MVWFFKAVYIDLYVYSLPVNLTHYFATNL